MQKVIAFVGPGGAGKSTQAELIRQQYDFPKPVNYATRLQRGPEDTDYRFVDKPDFAQKLIQGELRNSAIFNENLYGFHKDTFNHPQVLIAGIVPQQIVDIHGQLMKSKGELLTVFFALSDEECRERMLQRGDSIETVEKRIQADKTVQLYGPILCKHTIATNRSREEIFNELQPIVHKFLHPTI